ncbi:MAG: GvpL/GvpF family gas vesicle protein [Pseudomonadota bacterium]
MRSHELICVVAGGDIPPPDDLTQCVHAGPYTAVLSSAPRPAMVLPMSRKTAMTQAAERQKVYEALLPSGTVLAAKPQQWMQLDQAAAFLTCNAPVFDDLCAWLDAKVQFQITVAWDEKNVLGHFRDAPEIAPLFSAEQATAPMLEHALARLRNRLAGQVRHLLDTVVTDIIALPITDGMLCNLVALVPASEEEQLDRCIEQIDAIWSEGLNIRQIGPSAAGSFALLDLDWIAAETVDAACARLSLSVGASAEERRTARRRALISAQHDASEIRLAARIVDAAQHASKAGFHLATVLSEDPGMGDTNWSAVA